MPGALKRSIEITVAGVRLVYLILAGVLVGVVGLVALAKDAHLGAVSLWFVALGAVSLALIGLVYRMSQDLDAALDATSEPGARISIDTVNVVSGPSESQQSVRNALEPIRGETLRLTDIPKDGTRDLIRGYVFIDCRIVGPAVIHIDHGTLSNCVINAHPLTHDSIIWPVSDSQPVIVGAVIAQNCTFENCSFEGIGFAMYQSQVDGFKASIKRPSDS